MQTNKFKSFFSALGLTSFLFILGACGDETSNSDAKAAEATDGNSSEYEVLELKYQGWPNSVTYPELAEDLGYLAPIKLDWVGNTTSGPQEIQTAATGEIDFGGAFNGAIINLANSGAKIKAVVGYMGADELTNDSLSVLEDSGIKSAKDLIGKTVGVNALGALAESIVKEYLKQDGLTEDEIQQVTLVTIPPVNAELALRNKQVDAALLGSVISQRAQVQGGIRSLTTNYELWGGITYASYIFREDFIEKNPNTTKKFVEAIAKAVNWAQTTPRDEVVARYEKIINERDRQEDTQTLEYWLSSGIVDPGGLIAEKSFELWSNGAPIDDYYTNEFNPFNK